MLDAGTHPVLISSSLYNYPYTPQFADPTGTFNVTMIDPCLQTEIQMIAASPVENLVSFAGYCVTSYNEYVLNDTGSINFTLSTDTVDFCGEKQIEFSLNGTTTTLLSG